MSRRHKLRPKPLVSAQKKKHRSRKKSAIWYLFFPHVKQQLDAYGQICSGIQFAGMQFVSALLLFAGCGLLRMQIWARIPVALLGAILFPAGYVNQKRRQFEKKRFSEAGIYMEQMLYAFLKEQKIVTALKNVQTLFPNGRMRNVLDAALKRMETDYISQSPVHVALQEIEQEYACDRLHAMHQFMEKVETLGGNFSDSIELLLNDKHLWEKRIVERQKEASATMRNVAVSIALSLIVCASTLYFMPEDLNILAFRITHLTSAAVLLLDLFLLYKADCRLTCNWLKFDESIDEQIKQEQYLRLVSYDEKREQKKSLLYSFLPLIFLVVNLMKQEMGKSVCFGILFLFCLMQHKIGYALNRKRVIREVEMAFPQWLMEMALLLQVDNVQVSLKKTYPKAPPILQPALQELLKKLEMNPQAVAPYTEFLQELELPGIQAAMKMLYSISNGTGGDATQQIHEIIQRNQILLDKAEKLQQEEQAAGCNIYFLCPMLSGAMKLILDLSIFLVAFLQVSGQ